MVDFGSLTVSQQTIKKIKNEFKDKDYLASEVVNKYLKDNNGSGSIKDVAQFMADFGEEKDAQVYLVAAALMDTNRDGKIEQAEYDKLKNLSKVCTQSTVDGTDLQALFDQLDVADTKLLDKISQNINSSLKQTDDAGSPVTGKSGVVRNSDGTFSLTVEKYRSGKVQDDGQGGKRYPNGTYWGIITNAYPNLSEAQKKQVYEMLGDLNGFDWQNHTLHPGDKIKLPVLEFDKNGNIVGHKTKSDNNTTSSVGTGTASKGATGTNSSTPKMVGNRGYEADYEIRNADGSVTRFTVPAGKTADIKNATGSIITDRVVNGKMQRTEEKDGVKTVYTYSGAKVDGKPIDKKEYDANGNLISPKMVGNRGYEADYEIRNADGSVTRFTVAAGKIADIKNATGPVVTDKVVNGKMQRTEEKDGIKTEYTYSGANVDGKPTTIKITNADGTSSIEERTYDSNGKIATSKIQNYDARGNKVSVSSKQIEKINKFLLDSVNHNVNGFNTLLAEIEENGISMRDVIKAYEKVNGYNSFIQLIQSVEPKKNSDDFDKMIEKYTDAIIESYTESGDIETLYSMIDSLCFDKVNRGGPTVYGYKSDIGGSDIPLGRGHQLAEKLYRELCDRIDEQAKGKGFEGYNIERSQDGGVGVGLTQRAKALESFNSHYEAYNELKQFVSANSQLLKNSEIANTKVGSSGKTIKELCNQKFDTNYRTSFNSASNLRNALELLKEFKSRQTLNL